MNSRFTSRKTRVLSYFAMAFLLMLFSSPATVAQSATTAKTSPCAKGGCIYVTNSGSGSVSIIANNDSVLSTTNLASGAVPIGAVYDAKAKMVFIADNGNGQVDEINPTTYKVVKSISGFPGAAFIACDDSIPACFVTQFGQSVVTSFNPTTLKVGKSITQCGAEPEFITFDSSNSMLYVGNNDGCVTVQNPMTGATTTVTVGETITGVAAAKNGEVYVDDSATNWVYIIKGTSVVQTLSPSGANNLQGDVYSPQLNRIWVANEGANNAFAITGTKIGKAVKLGSEPFSDCYDSRNQWTYVVNLGSGTVSVLAGNIVLTTVTVGTGPSGCASN